MSTPNQIFITACDIVGSQAEMARILGLSPSMVNQIAKGDRPLPDKYARAIEDATGGKVTRQQICPDDWRRYWPDLKEANHA